MRMLTVSSRLERIFFALVAARSGERVCVWKQYLTNSSAITIIFVLLSVLLKCKNYLAVTVIISIKI